MRTILMLSLLAALSLTTVVARPGVAESAEDLSITALATPGRTILTLRNEGPGQLPESITRLVVLPSGAANPSARLAASGEETGSGIGVTCGTPMILRGLTVLPVTIAPNHGLPAKSGGGTPLTIEVEISYAADANGKSADLSSPAVTYSRGFYAPFTPLLPEGQTEALSSAETGGYVIVTHPDFLPAAQTLAAWKTEMGFPVTVVTTDQTGGTNVQIRDYVAQLYATSPVPPQFLILIGDVERLPSFSFHASTSDHSYAVVDGDDFLPDIDVGRISANTLAEAQTFVAKILRYEQDPYVGDDPGWYRRGLVVAGDYGSTTPRAVSRWCREQLLDLGYAQVDSVYYPRTWTDHLSLIPNAINQGVSIVSYRGWAYGIHGWEPPHFTSAEVASLTNGWKLPVVFSFVCQNNDFGQPECFGEAWTRAGSPTEGKGAVAFIGNSEPWSHTRFNDACAIGAFNAIKRDGVRRMGSILNASKNECMIEFPGEIPYLSDTDESVEFYYYIYNLLGDPGMELFTDMPVPITVSYESQIPQGSNMLEVSVLETGSQDPVAGARVALSQGGALLGCAWTGPDGVARVQAGLEGTGQPVTVVVTGAGVAPFRGTANVFAMDAAPFAIFQNLSIDDDTEGSSAGNGDGIANPGETLELAVTLRNRSTQPAGEIQAQLTAIQGAEIITGTATYQDVAAGGDATSESSFVVKIPDTAEDSQVVRFLISTGLPSPRPLDLASVSEFGFTVRAPFLRHESSATGGDGILSPGETVDLSVTLRNDGSVGSSATAAVLRSLSELVTVVASGSEFAGIAAGASGTGTPFEVQASPTVAMGQTAVLELDLTTAEGYKSTTSFSIMVGVAGHTNPLGPDAHGYYAYDNSDTDYPDAAPLYDWIPCSTLYGGAGTKLTLRDNATTVVDLPFPFTFYGTAFDRILVSDNGWVSFDTKSFYDFYNWHLPNTYGTGAVIAPFWDNLDPLRKINEVPIADGVYTFHDAARHLFVIEWSRLPNARPELDDLQTFELILYDPAHYPVASGDGIIDCQYKQIVNDDDARMYATVGIESPGEDVGLEYSYANIYPPSAAPISAGLAIRFTTRPPQYSPFKLASFEASKAATGVRLGWEPIDGRPRNGYRIYRASGDGEFALLSGAILQGSARFFIDETAHPDSAYSYKVGSLDPVGRETVLGPFVYGGGSGGAAAFFLESRTPNPFRGSVALAYGLPRAGEASLQIHDMAGRLVRTISFGRAAAGSGSVVWDGRDDRDRDLPSGVYLCTLRSGADQKTLKLTLLR